MTGVGKRPPPLPLLSAPVALTLALSRTFLESANPVLGATHWAASGRAGGLPTQHPQEPWYIHAVDTLVQPRSFGSEVKAGLKSYFTKTLSAGRFEACGRSWDARERCGIFLMIKK